MLMKHQQAYESTFNLITPFFLLAVILRETAKIIQRGPNYRLIAVIVGGGWIDPIATIQGRAKQSCQPGVVLLSESPTTTTTTT